MQRTRPSLAGRRVALDRKWRLNVAEYNGPVSLLTLTAPGRDLLPFDCDGVSHRGMPCGGDLGCKVEYIYAEVWNRTAQARASRLFEAATRYADRYVRRLYGGQLPRQIGNVRSPQKRGVHHFHWSLPQATEVERVWSRTVRRFIETVTKREARTVSAEDRWRSLWHEYCTGESTRGVYGFGFAHPGRAQYGANGEKVAAYMARNAAAYLADNAGSQGRHYVSSRLTRATGVTMRALRACNWLYVRRLLIDRGELDDEWVPSHWSDEWSSEVMRVWARVAGAPSGP